MRTGGSQKKSPLAEAACGLYVKLALQPRYRIFTLEDVDRKLCVPTFR